MPTMSQIKVSVKSGDKMKNVVSDLKNFQVQGEDIFTLQFDKYYNGSTNKAKQTLQDKESEGCK